MSVTIYGNGGYYISGVSNSGIISANINGNTLTVLPTVFGGSTITICESDSQCGIFSVVGTNNSQQSTTNNANQLPALSSFTISSNNANGNFIGTNNVLTLSFTANKLLTSASISINGMQLGISGTDSGPYTTNYNVTGYESSPIPVLIRFGDFSGNVNQATFSIGNYSAPVLPVPTYVPPPTYSLPAGCTSTSGFSTATGQSCNGSSAPSPVIAAPQPSIAPSYVFSQFLSLNSTGNEVSELQKRLTTLGFYSGPITGTFGPLTEAAVKKFQKAHGISQAGYVGPSTRALFNK